MKFLKISLYTILGLFAVLLLAAFLVPILFKDTIKQKIDASVAESVDAKVYFDADRFNLSLFQNFPSLTISMEEFGVANNAPFEGDTLVAVQSFEVSVDVMSALFGDQIKVNGVYLNNPNIHAIVHADGKANWDIAKPSETPAEETPTEEGGGALALSVDEWKITNGNIRYDDATMPIEAIIKNLNHTGSGKIADVYDLATKTTIEELSVNFDSVQYLDKNKLDVDMTLNLDLNNSKYTFKENTIKLNDFSFGFDGYVAMPDTTTMEMDITYKAKETAFKNILSLVPGVFLEGFEQLKTSGDLAFDGFVKGKMVGDQLPTFGLNLSVKDGMFQYPDLPTSVNNVAIDLNVDNQDGVINNTAINLRNFHMDMGKNPIDMKAIVKGLEVMDIDANVKGKLNLADLSQIYPMEGLSMKGLFAMDITAQGIYDSTKALLPRVDALMTLKDGYVKSADVPFPLENMQFTTTATVPNMTDAEVTVQNFRVAVDGEEFVANVYAKNLEDISYKMGASGVLNLTKMTKVYPLEGMEIQGIVSIDTFSTAGTMALIDAEQYDQLPTAGAMAIKDFLYADKEILGDKKFKIESSQMTFNPQKINLASFQGSVGNSDLNMSGYIDNYIPYVFKDHTLKGKLNFASKLFDVNEWMEEDTTVTTTTETVEEPLTVIEVPKNIDFVLASNLDKVLYDNMDMTDMKGNIIVRDGAIRMEGITFNLLSGQIGMDGEYSTRDINHPTFDYKLRVKNLGIKEAYETFSTVQKFVPGAESIIGTFSTNFAVNGELGQDMMPLYNTMSGGGLINITEAKLQNLRALEKVGSALKMKKSLSESKVVNLIMDAKIENGRMSVKPFDVKLGGMKTNVVGSTGFDGTLDYKLAMDVPAGAQGQAVNSFLGNDGKSDVRVNLGLTGQSTDPDVKVLKSDVVNNAINNKKKEVKNQITTEVNKQKQQVKKDVKNKVDKEVEKQKEQVTKDVKDQVGDKLKDKIKIKKPW